MSTRMKLGAVILTVLTIICAECVSARNSIPEARGEHLWKLREDDRPIGCLPHVAQIIEEHEGRRSYSYMHRGGYRAVGAGYNLDDSAETRKAEMKILGANYEEIYGGDWFLNDGQISGLLFFDASRALQRAEQNVPLHDFCCPIQAVFADIQHSSGGATEFPSSDMEKTIEEARKGDFKSAGEELKKTDWCAKQHNVDRCISNRHMMKDGCNEEQFKSFLGDH